MSNPAAITPEEHLRRENEILRKWHKETAEKLLAERSAGKFWCGEAHRVGGLYEELTGEHERLSAFIRRPLWVHAVERFMALWD